MDGTHRQGGMTLFLGSATQESDRRFLPSTRVVELEGAGEGQRRGRAGGGWGGQLGAEAGPPVPSLCSLTLTARRCAEWSGKQRNGVGRGVSWARESPRLAARRSRLEEAQVSLEFQPRSQRLGPEHLV